MKVLFICRANVGRSQAAMELYRQLGGVADSAGTRVDEPGQLLMNRPAAATIVRVMQNEYGIDMSHNVRIQATPSMAAAYDKLIVMAEPETIPTWLAQDVRTELWTVPDPAGKTERETSSTVRDIAQKVASIRG